MFFIRFIIAFGFIFLFIGMYLFTGLIAAATISTSVETGIIIGIAILGGYLLFTLLFSYVWARLSYKYYKYELTNDEFRKEHGVIWKRYVSIPISRVQNVDIMRGIVARALGLSDIQIHTAGVGGQARGEGRLPGLSRIDAEAFREELLKKVKKAGKQGL